MTTKTFSPDGAVARLARLCYRRRRTAVLLWVLGAVAVMAVGFSLSAEASNSFGGGGSDSGKAQKILDAHFPKANGDSITLAIQADRDVRDPAVKARVQPALDRLARTPHVTAVSSPYQGPGRISADGRIAFATAQLDVRSNDMPAAEVTKLISDVRGDKDGVRLALGGSSVAAAETPGGGPSEGIGVLAAMCILLIAFGSVLAMGLPIVTALFGIGTALALIGLLGHLLPAPSFSPIVAALIGLGVGIDYALFIVTRYREALHDGEDPETATVTALATAGRAVLFAGTTVVIAMLGLLVMGDKLLAGVAVAASTTVLMTMVTAVTLLPALLGFTGRGIDRLRVPGLGRRAERPLAERWADLVQRRPVPAVLVAAGLLAVLAVPALSMRLSL
ncbi:MMPL family transporter, partial [Spirillospora sp. NPDC049652]